MIVRGTIAPAAPLRTAALLLLGACSASVAVGSGEDRGAPPGDGGPVGAGGDSGTSPDLPSGPADGPAATEDELAYLRRIVPVLWIDVKGQTITDATKIEGTIKVIENHDGSLIGIEKRPAALEARLGIAIHGNSSSWIYDQRPFSIEFRDATGQELAVSLLGLPEESDFILHSCFSDKTCMRNALSYAIGRQLAAGSGRWGAPRTRWVEVFLDGKYWGLYLLAEKIKRDDHRVDIPKPAPDATAGDVTGGYIFSNQGGAGSGLDRLWPDALTPDRYWGYRYPNPDVITPEQMKYLQGAVGSLQRKIAANPRWSYAKTLIDPQSTLDFIVSTEISNNIDGYNKSWYFYKEPDAAGGRFFMGPLWDYDIAYGNVNYDREICVNTLRMFTDLMYGPRAPFVALFDDPSLHDEIRCRYNDLRRSRESFDVARIESEIDAFTAHISRAKARDQARWKNIGHYVWPNNYVGASWADEIRYLKFWLRKRVAWLDAHLVGSCPGVPAHYQTPVPGPVPPPIKETGVRGVTGNAPLYFGGAPVYIPIDGPVPAEYASFSCQRP